jgi:hypothetical protein
MSCSISFRIPHKLGGNGTWRSPAGSEGADPARSTVLGFASDCFRSSPIRGHSYDCRIPHQRGDRSPLVCCDEPPITGASNGRKLTSLTPAQGTPQALHAFVSAVEEWTTERCRVETSRNTRTSRSIRPTTSPKATKAAVCPRERPSAAHGLRSTGTMAAARRPAGRAGDVRPAIPPRTKGDALEGPLRHHGPPQTVPTRRRKPQPPGNEMPREAREG